MAEVKEKKLVTFSDRVNVKATKKTKYMRHGEVYSVHPTTAENYIKRGLAEKVK